MCGVATTPQQPRPKSADCVFEAVYFCWPRSHQCRFVAAATIPVDAWRRCTKWHNKAYVQSLLAYNADIHHMALISSLLCIYTIYLVCKCKHKSIITQLQAQIDGYIIFALHLEYSNTSRNGIYILFAMISILNICCWCFFNSYCSSRTF